jgi:hypothetical protein
MADEFRTSNNDGDHCKHGNNLRFGKCGLCEREPLSSNLVARLRAEYGRTGAYAPEATCRHGIHPYDCRQGCAPPGFEAADEIERLRAAIHRAISELPGSPSYALLALQGALGNVETTTTTTEKDNG